MLCKYEHDAMIELMNKLVHHRRCGWIFAYGTVISRSLCKDMKSELKDAQI